MTEDSGRVRGTIRGQWRPRTVLDPDESAAGTVAEPRESIPAPLDAGDALAGLRERQGALTLLAAIAAFVVVAALRLAFIARAYDIFTDEVTYLDVARNLASGHGVTLHGNPFFLHPPLFFVIEGAVVALFHPSGLVIDQVQAIRALNALLAGITGAAIFAIVRQVSGLKAALPALALFALDPFLVRINSRNLIETSAFMWVALGYLVLLSAISTASGERARDARWRVVVAGFLFGFALLSKEMTAFLTVVPLGLAFLIGWSLPRRESIVAIAVAAAVYAIYPVATLISGLGSTFADQKFSGVLRFLGVVKTTGFVASGGPSFWTAVTQNLDVFATTYVLIALGIPACIVLLAWGDPRRRMLGLLGASAYALLAYSIKFGTLEEQFFYYLVLPALITVSVAWWVIVEEKAMAGEPIGWPEMLRSRLARLDRARLSRARTAVEEAVAIVAPVALSVALAWSALVWFQVHLTPDDGYARLLAYMRRNVANGTAIGVTTDPQQFVLQGYVIEQIDTTQPLAGGKVRYVAISTKQIEQGYVRNGVPIAAWLRAHAQPVFAFSGRSYGTLELYRITPALTESTGTDAGTAAGS